MHASSKTNKTLALFDFDGTLCPKDSFTGFIFYALSKRHIVKQGLKILPWIQAYYLNIYPAHAMRPKLYQAMFGQADAKQISAIAQQYAEKLIVELNPELYQQLLQHQALGDDVVLISASLDLYLQPICQLLNIALICTETEVKQGQLTGQLMTPDCSAEQKAIRLQQHYPLQDYQKIYAYGNSHEDLAMLQLAHHPYMVGQDHRLPCLKSRQQQRA
ncbi:HAD-IB family hydrolase [Acinetobacter larvae]|uniref:Phosphoserine phosphatase n=1 Tax=Acinetobacter larvae TaxID=1789224 RepID=A0A1B2M046_9GAMM|nr:HAD-IB family hydrolase [Acinetobacter larvae]AOA58566.1 phosphoserine phosphatase [Acinetobacter larvae]